MGTADALNLSERVGEVVEHPPLEGRRSAGLLMEGDATSSCGEDAGGCSGKDERNSGSRPCQGRGCRQASSGSGEVVSLWGQRGMWWCER